jgi:3-hydroxybutyryl-CoA dehydrogenase
MSEIKSVGVLGAGTMGHGIAQVAAQAGYRTLLYDVTTDLAQRGLRRIAENLQRGIEKGKVKPEDREQVLGRLRAVADLPELAQCDLIIEAIPEDLALKRSIFARLSEVCSTRTILASNTSSLSVSEIAAAASHPERVLGMHFFNPVHIMRLLEIVRAEPTSDATVETVRRVAGSLGKETIVVRDRPGFASSRLGLALGLEAIRMVEQDGTAQAGRPRRTRRPALNCRISAPGASQRGLQAAPAAQGHGQRRQARPEERRGVLQILSRRRHQAQGRINPPGLRCSVGA